MMPSFLAANAAGLLVAALLLVVRFSIQRPKFNRRGPYPLPPGPPGEPILGHFRVIPAVGPEHKYIEWGKQYCKHNNLYVVEGKMLTFNSKLLVCSISMPWGGQSLCSIALKQLIISWTNEVPTMAAGRVSCYSKCESRPPSEADTKTNTG